MSKVADKKIQTNAKRDLRGLRPTTYVLPHPISEGNKKGESQEENDEENVMILLG